MVVSLLLAAVVEFSGYCTVLCNPTPTPCTASPTATPASTPTSTPAPRVVFVVAGQSNSSGSFIYPQPYAGDLPGLLFGNDYVWKPLADPTDSTDGQVDIVSQEDPRAHMNSIWPIFATFASDYLNRQVAIVPTARGGTHILQWVPGYGMDLEPGHDHWDRTTLYGSMIYRAQQSNATAILWWQGESNSTTCTPRAYYADKLNLIVDGVWADVGIPTVLGKIHHLTGPDEACQQAIRDAVDDVIASNPHALPGPDLSVMDSDDGGYHLTSNESAVEAATLWWGAVRTAFGW